MKDLTKKSATFFWFSSIKSTFNEMFIKPLQIPDTEERQLLLNLHRQMALRAAITTPAAVGDSRDQF